MDIMAQTQPGSNPAVYYWITGNYNGRLFVIGPKSNEQEAYTMGYEKLDCPFDVVALKTRDKGAATGILKARLLERTGNLDQALQRARHTV